MKFFAVLSLIAVTASSTLSSSNQIKGLYAFNPQAPVSHSNGDAQGGADSRNNGAKSFYGITIGGNDGRQDQIDGSKGQNDGRQGQNDRSKGQNDGSKGQNDGSKGQIYENQPKAYGLNPIFIQPPVKTLPLPSFHGQFALSLPQCDLEIRSNNFIFKDCNTHQVPFWIKNSQFFFGSRLSINTKCDYDRASVYLGLLPRVTKHVNHGNSHDFYDQYDQLLFSVGLQGLLRNSLTTNDLFQDGVYTAQLPKYNVEVIGNQIWAQGCPKDPITFESDKNLDVSFRNYFEAYAGHQNDHKDCAARQQDIFGDAFKNSIKIIQKNNQYDFQDRFGRTLAYWKPFSW